MKIARMLCIGCVIALLLSGCAHTHTSVKVEKVPAGCTEAGTKAHFFCTDCKKQFWDEACKETARPEELQIPALGHTDQDMEGACDRCGMDMPEDMIYHAETDTYVIYTAEGFKNVQKSSKKFVLARDIVLSEELTLDLNGDDIMDSNWKPEPFWGILDGQGHTVSGLRIKDANNGAGLFMHITDATIKNLHLVDLEILSNSAAGGIAGNAATSQIIGCTVSGTIRNTSYIAGGIVGNVSETKLIGCVNTATVEAIDRSGGIAGQTVNAQFIGCINTGDIRISSEEFGPMVGGVVASANGGVLAGCYSTGRIQAISSTTWTGGIAGRLTGCVEAANFWDMTGDQVLQGNGMDKEDPHTWKVDGTTITWNHATEDMNRALEERQCPYRYVMPDTGLGPCPPEITETE